MYPLPSRSLGKGSRKGLKYFMRGTGKQQRETRAAQTNTESVQPPSDPTKQKLPQLLNPSMAHS